MTKEDDDKKNKKEETNWGLVIGLPLGIFSLFVLWFIYNVYIVNQTMSDKELRRT